MKKLLTLIALLPMTAGAGEITDRIKDLPRSEWVWQSLHLVDGIQTYKAAQRPDLYREVNPLLGPHPSTGEVVAYTVGMSILHAAAASYIQRTYGEPSLTFFEYTTIAVKGAGVAINFKVLW